jgi:hypothetical protein
VPEEIRDFLPTEAGPEDDRAVVRRMLEALLDPRAIRWLLTLGGSLAVVGLIVWAYSKHFFDSPLRQAGLFGVGTLALFAAGWWLTLRTRHTTAGVALTFLAAVVAPLNLWFYDAQKLLTVDGYLWAAGLACCGLYAATFYALRRPIFLYAFQIGVTLTALLLLGHFGEVGVTGLCVTLAAFGAVAVHLERAFPAEGTFNRRTFGPPLLSAGLAQLGLALAVLLPVQAFAWFDLPASTVTWLIDASRLHVSPLAATGLWLAGAYVAFYVAIAPRRAGGWTMLAAAACLLMAEATVLIGTDATAEGAVIALALTGAVACVAASRLPQRADLPNRAAVAAAVAVSALPVLLGYLLIARGTMPSFKAFGWFREIGASYALAMTLASACLAASAAALRSRRLANAVLRYFTAGGVLLAAAGAVRLLDAAPWSIRAALLALIPIAYLIEGTLRKDDTDVSIAYSAFGLFSASLLLAVCHHGLDLFVPRPWKSTTLGVAIVALEIVAFLLTTAARCERKGQRDGSAVLSLAASGALAGAAWQGLGYCDATPAWPVAVYLAAGLLPLAVSRIINSTRPTLARPLFLCGAALLLATTVVVDLKGLSLMAAARLAWRHFGEAGLVILATLAAAAVAPNRAWRRGFLAASAVSAVTAVVLLAALSRLTPWQRFEVLCVTLGTLLLVLGHIGRFRETPGRPEDLVDAALWIGGALVTLILAGTAFHRRFFAPPRSLPDELALVTFGLLMLSTGVAFRFKATTLYGGGALGGYLVVLLVSILRRPEVAMGAYLAAAGAALFLVGLALSIYRDRLLKLPDRIANHEGVFRILDWR